MLVEQHSDGYPAHVETIQEVLNVLADDRVCAVRLLVLHHPLSHGRDHVVVSVADLYDRICETKSRREKNGNSTNNRGGKKRSSVTDSCVTFCSSAFLSLNFRMS